MQIVVVSICSVAGRVLMDQALARLVLQTTQTLTQDLKFRSFGSTGSGNYPGRIKFLTTANGASSPTERVRIDRDAGAVKIGCTLPSSPNIILQANGNYEGYKGQISISPAGIASRQSSKQSITVL